jgi:hypothetical protein
MPLTTAPRFLELAQFRHRLSGVVLGFPLRCLLRSVADISRRQLSPPQQGWSGKRIHTKRTEHPDCGSIGDASGVFDQMRLNSRCKAVTISAPKKGLCPVGPAGAYGVVMDAN